MLTDYSGRMAIVALIAVAAISYSCLLGRPAFRLDDAYIVLNNADALWTEDLSFPNVPPFSASTSLLHTLATAALVAVFEPEIALLALAWAGLLAFGLGCYQIGRDFDLSPLSSVILAICAMTTGDVIQVHLNGLETGWMMAGIVWVLVLLRRPSALVPLTLMCAALPYIRPELFLLSAMAMSTLLFRSYRQREFRRAIIALVCFAALFGLLLALQRYLSGELLPSTGEAKRHFFEGSKATMKSKLEFASIHSYYFLVFILGPATIGFFAIRGVSSLIGLAFAVVLIISLAIAYPVIIDQNHYRYLYFLIPVAFGNIAAMASSGNLQMRRLAQLTVIASLGFNLFQLVTYGPRNLSTVIGKRVTLEETAEWIRSNLEPNEMLMLHDIGYMSFATDQLLFDLVGLKSPMAVRINRELRYHRGYDGLGSALAEMAKRSDACVLLVSTGWNQQGYLTIAMSDHGWSLTPHPAENPPGHEAYILTSPAGKKC